MLQSRIIRKISLTVVAAALTGMLSPLAAAYASTEKQAQLEPSRTHEQTLKNLARTLRIGHYRKLIIDDQFSSRLFDAYLEQLDRNRLYFLESDIEEFEKYRFRLDDAIASADLDFAYRVFNRFQIRNRQRLEYLLSRVDRGLERLDFAIDEQLETDRSEAPWSRTSEQLDDLWRKRLKSTVLNFKLSDKELGDAQELLHKRYSSQIDRIDQLNSDDVFQTYANALSSLYGPHTQYYSPRRIENFNIDMRLSLEGIGAVLQTEYENTKIARLIPKGPAEKTGKLNPSDLIVGVAQGEDGEMVDVVGWRLNEVVDLIRGPKGSIVRLQIIPAGSETRLTREVVIVRNKVKLEEKSAQKRIIEVPHNGGVQKLGLISIPTFYLDFDGQRNGDPEYRSTTRDVERLLKELLAEGIEGLIIDLRNNGGGALQEAIDLAGLFISRGPVVQVKDSWGQIRVEFDQDPKYYDVPLAVLVNRLSASASEIFAGAMKDYNRGIIIGGQTFGKGTVQILHPLNSGQVKLTRSKFYRISGDSTQNRGVKPHITLPSPFDPEEVGESASPAALPWDQVKPLPHISFPGFDHLLGSLNQAHRSRISEEPDFLAILERIDYVKERRLEQTVTLNEQILRRKRDEEERWKLDLENRRRIAKNQQPLVSLEDLGKDTEEQDNESSPEEDVLLRESGRVLLDLMDYAQR